MINSVALYIRVSTDEQADKGNSLTEQQERLTAYCKAMGWPDPVLYIDDGYSAKDLKRPAIQRLLADVEQDKINIVITSKLDRLCRNLLDLLQTIDLFSQHDCSYVSASESFDTSTAVGRMTLQLLGTFAEFERERISERVKDNMMSIAKNTDKAITRPCFGYDLVDGKYAINEEEAPYVKLMFDLAEEGHGHRMIAKILNDRGSTTKLGKMWDQINVKRLMKTETITGAMVYNKRQTKNGKTIERDKSEWIIKENNHPAIISTDQFEKVHQIFDSRKRSRKHADSETYLLTGLVQCKFCGKNMKGNTTRYKRETGDYTYYRYICSSYVMGYGCRHHTVHRDDLEETIIEQIKLVSSLSKTDLKKISIAPTTSVADEIRQVKDALARTDKRMQKQIEAYENDLISAADLKTARQRIELERQRLNEQLESLQKKDREPAKLQENAVRLMDDILSADRVKAKAAIRQLIDNIKIENDLENGLNIDVVWKI